MQAISLRVGETVRASSGKLDPDTVSFHIASMRNETQDERRTFGWTLPASLALHVLIAAFLIFGLPESLPKPQEDEAVNVELVKPPEPPEKPKPEPPPPPPPKPEKPPEKVETPEKEATQPAPAPVLKPVFRFGKKDAGPRQALDGNSGEEGSAKPATPEDADKKEAARQQAPAELEAKSGGVPAPAPEKDVAPKPADNAKDKEQKETKLTEAKRLFSRSITGDPIAMSAMAGLPRGVRAGQLCSSELGQQLLNGTPSYFPERVPLYPLDTGTVLDEPEAAFRANGGWYDVSFRCEINEDATRVLSFAFRVGDPIPRGEWKSRGLPAL